VNISSAVGYFHQCTKRGTR